MIQFHKYHALGNDYIVLDPKNINIELSVKQIKLLCHRNYGIGSDGILYGPSDTDKADFGLRIFNPDGSEAEKSGNGLRIFCKYLWDIRMVQNEIFTVDTPGGIVQCLVHPTGRSVDVEMGRVTFDSQEIPVKGPKRQVINETISLMGEDYRFSAASIGNPHCVFVKSEISEKETRELGPLIETDDRFPNKVNVQFCKVLDQNNIRIEIWERGAGYTLASGSSSSAAAAVVHKLGLCGSNLTVHMPGGPIEISITKDFNISMSGPVTKVAEGTTSQELFTKLPNILKS